MPKFNSSLTTFSKGYLSKRMAARPDIEEYYQSCSELINLIPIPQGGLKKRQGTLLVSQVPDEIITSAGGRDPILFSHYTNEAELTFALYYTYTDGIGYQNPIGLVGGGYTINDTGVTSGAMETLNLMLNRASYSESAMQTISMGNYTVIYSQSGLYAPVIFYFKVVGSTLYLYADTWFSAGFEDLPPAYTRTPYKEIETSITATTTGGITAITSTKSIFSAASVGQYYRFDTDWAGPTTTSYFILITSYTSPTSVSGVLAGGSVNFTTPIFKRAYFGPETGFPRCATSFQNRAVWANVFEAPDTFFGSHVSNKFFFLNSNLASDKEAIQSDIAATYNFYGGIKDTDPYVFDLASQYDTPIRWIAGGNVLYVGKADAEYIVTGYDNLLGPLNVSIQKKASEGGALSSAIALEEGTFYISANKKETNFLIYNERNGNSSSIGVSSTSYGLVDDIAYKNGNTRFSVYLKQLMYFPPANLLFAVLGGEIDRNNLLTLNYNSSVNSFAWAEFQIAGDAAEGSTSVVLSITQQVNSGKMYAIIRRTDAGGVKHTIETWSASNDLSVPRLTVGDETWTEGKFIPFDSCKLLAYTGTAYTEISQTSLYANKSMMLYSDQGITPITFDATGLCTLPYPVMWGWYGYAYQASLTTVNLQYGRASDTALGVPKKIDSLTFSLLNSKGGEWSDKESYAIRYPDSSYYTGDIVMRADTNFSVTPTITITHSDPEPFNLLALTFRGVGYGD